VWTSWHRRAAGPNSPRSCSAVDGPRPRHETAALCRLSPAPNWSRDPSGGSGAHPSMGKDPSQTAPSLRAVVCSARTDEAPGIRSHSHLPADRASLAARTRCTCRPPHQTTQHRRGAVSACASASSSRDCLPAVTWSSAPNARAPVACVARLRRCCWRFQVTRIVLARHGRAGGPTQLRDPPYPVSRWFLLLRDVVRLRRPFFATIVPCSPSAFSSNLLLCASRRRSRPGRCLLAGLPLPDHVYAGGRQYVVAKLVGTRAT